MSTHLQTRPDADSQFQADLRRALVHANLPTLLLVLHQLTGDDRWLREPYAPTPGRGLDDHDDAGLAPAVQAEVRASAEAAILAAVFDGAELPCPPGPDRLPKLLATSLAEDVPEEYGSLLAEELGSASREVRIEDGVDRTRLDVLIVGAGMAGINMGVMLKRAGIPFTIVEKNHEVGGTWLENRYPGCGVDTPSHLYSFSFAKSSRWGSYFAKRDELHEYFIQVARENGLLEHIRFGLEVQRAAWDAESRRWLVTTRGDHGVAEELEAAVFISGVGHFNRPSIPDIPGLGDFSGPVMHTARWDADVDVRGKRVAVVGTGASAMQVVPALAGVAEHVTVFQRSRQWAIPHPNCGRPVSTEVQWLLEHVPFYAGFYRLRQFWRFGDRLHPALQVDEAFDDPEYAVNAMNAAHRRFLTGYIERELEGRPDLVAASLPDYPTYGKRPLIDHGWYRAIRRDDVTLVETGLRAVHDGKLVAADGAEHETDVIVLATGFKTLEMLGPMDVVGDGVALRDVWGADDARAYLGVTVPRFPNFFMLFGPNTSTGHGGSAFLTTEMQVRYVMQLLKAMLETGLDAVDVRAEVHDAYNERVDAALSRTVWTHPSVDNYYRNSAGRIVGTNPWRYVEYWRQTREADLADYNTTKAIARQAA